MDSPLDAAPLLIGALAVGILFVPIPVVTQLVGVPLLVLACYLRWGLD